MISVPNKNQILRFKFRHLQVGVLIDLLRKKEET